MNTVLRRYICMRETEKRGKNKQNKRQGIVCTVSDNELTRRSYSLKYSFNKST